MERRFLHLSGGTYHHTRSHFLVSESSQRPVPISQATLSSFPPVPASTIQRSLSLQQPTFSSCEPSLMPKMLVLSSSQLLPSATTIVPSLPQPDITATPPTLQTPTPSLRAILTQATSSSTSTQRLITSAIPGKPLEAGFLSTPVSTVLDTNTTSSTSQTLLSLIPPTSLPPLPNHHSAFITRMSTDAKFGILLGLVIIIAISLLVLTRFLFICRKRRARTIAARYPRPLAQRLLSYARETEPLTASTQKPYMDIEVIPAGEPKTSMDEGGIRWPEPVVLRGSAKEVREWTEEYGRLKVVDEKGRLESYGFWRGGD